MKKFKIGEVVELTKDSVVKTALSGNEKTFKVGTLVTMNSNSSIVYPDGGIQKLGGEYEIKGYDNEAIAKRVFNYLSGRLEINEWLEEFDLTKEDVINVIEESLDDILF